MYCAVVLDAWSRRVVGWSIELEPSTALVTNALGMAIDQRRRPGTPSSTATRGRSSHRGRSHVVPSNSGLLPSIGSVGDCYDNAMMESFWSRRRSNCSTGSDGAHASNWPARSSNTSRSSTIASDVTHR